VRGVGLCHDVPFDGEFFGLFLTENVGLFEYLFGGRERERGGGIVVVYVSSMLVVVCDIYLVERKRML
jgi:hypothetical protein